MRRLQNCGYVENYMKIWDKKEEGRKESASPPELKFHREHKLWRDLRQDSPIHTVTGHHAVMTICGSQPDPFTLWTDEREECL